MRNFTHPQILRSPVKNLPLDSLHTRIMENSRPVIILVHHGGRRVF